MLGYGQQARSGAARCSTRLRDTPETPGEAWGPPGSVKRRGGTASPRVGLGLTQRSAGSRSHPDTAGGRDGSAATATGKARG